MRISRRSAPLTDIRARYLRAASCVLVMALAAACGQRAPQRIQEPPGDDTREQGGLLTDDDSGDVPFITPPEDEDKDSSIASCSVAAPRILFLHGGAIDRSHPFATHARKVLRDHRLAYEIRELGERFAYEVDGLGQYAAVVITDHQAYEDLAPAPRAALDDYARACDVGLYFLRVPSGAQLDGGSIATSASTPLSDAHVDAASPLLDLTRDGGVLAGAIPGRGRLFELAREGDYHALAWATGDDQNGPWLVAGTSSRDGIRRIFNGRDFEPFFLDELLMVDALAWLSPVDLSALRERYVGVDIDDVFMPAHHEDLAQRTVKIQAEDVPALIETQERISEIIGSEFRFALGFNAGFYGSQRGDPALFDDAAGDAALVDARASFHWFDHLWRHTIVIDQPYEELAGDMERARAWAQDTGVIEHIGRYAISPQHSGTSQRYDPLYQAWRDVWDIRYSACTSDAGDGFEHLGVLVAPRARAQIWSNQYSFDQVSRSALDQLAHAGSVYRVIVERPVTVFMTHQSNYARDRIGSYLFEEVFAFLARWTRYEIKTGAPDDLIQKHFELVPLQAP